MYDAISGTVKCAPIVHVTIHLAHNPLIALVFAAVNANEQAKAEKEFAEVNLMHDAAAEERVTAMLRLHVGVKLHIDFDAAMMIMIMIMMMIDDDDDDDSGLDLG
jgi:hypothetical protein